MTARKVAVEIWMVLLVAVVLPLHAQASRWVEVGRTEKEILLVDSATVVRSGAHTIIAWSTEADPRGRPVFIYRHEYDCVGQRTRMLYMVMRDSTGAPFFSGAAPDSNWSPVVPGTDGELTFRVACRLGQSVH